MVSDVYWRNAITTCMENECANKDTRYVYGEILKKPIRTTYQLEFILLRCFSRGFKRIALLMFILPQL